MLTRRTMVLGAAGIAVATNAAAIPSTIPMALGPFYPVVKPSEDDADLTRLAGHRARAKGEVIELMGRVLDGTGKPVSGARIELWQANAAGRYAHHGDQHPAPLDLDFQGYGVQKADAEGHYRFLTIHPGAYPAGDYMRAAHLHFDVEGRYSRLVTQMYFKGDRWLNQDRTLHQDLKTREDRYPDSIFAAELGAGTERGARRLGFDLVLYDG
jgi:protocatechuate 3,4-dioxygenase beta subunit